MWEAVERFHGLCYTAPEVRSEATAAGLKGFWMNYFASRISPVGAVGPDVVQSSFFYYGPARVQRAIPDAWRFSTPAEIITARFSGMQQALHRTYGSVASPQVIEAVELVQRAASYCDPIGRTIFAGYASLSWPQDPYLALWHGCTLLREYRSGNHLIAICAEGLSGCESVVSHVAVDGAPSDWIQDEAGWSAQDHDGAVASLQDRGWLDEVGDATPACYAGRARIEALTDKLDAPVWARLGPENGQRLFDTLGELAQLLPPDDQLDWKSIYES